MDPTKKCSNPGSDCYGEVGTDPMYTYIVLMINKYEGINMGKLFLR